MDGKVFRGSYEAISDDPTGDVLLDVGHDTLPCINALKFAK
jgi:hypothetical protein